MKQLCSKHTEFTMNLHVHYLTWYSQQPAYEGSTLVIPDFYKRKLTNKQLEDNSKSTFLVRWQI